MPAVGTPLHPFGPTVSSSVKLLASGLALFLAQPNSCPYGTVDAPFPPPV